MTSDPHTAASSPVPLRCCADATACATAAFLAQHLTVVVNTSPCAAHPSTRVLEETCASLALAPGLAACRLLLVFDGFKLRDRLRVKRGFVTPDVAAAYDRYVARCELLAATPGSPLQGAQLLRLEEHHGCAHALRRGLARTRTPYVLVVQHGTLSLAGLLPTSDSPMTDRALCAYVDMEALVRALQAAPDVNYIGLARARAYAHEPREASRGLAPCQPREVCGVRLVALGAFLDSTHVASVAWYRRRVFGTERRCPLPRGCFLEDTLGQAQLAELRRVGPASHAFYGTWLAHAGETQGTAVAHLDGHDQRCDHPDWHKWRHAHRHTSSEAWAQREAAGELRYGDPPRCEVALGFHDAAALEAEEAIAALDPDDQDEPDASCTTAQDEPPDASTTQDSSLQ